MKNTAVYIGRRATVEGKIVQAFLLPTGKTVLFKGVSGVFIGGTYECNGKQISKRPKRIDVDVKNDPDWEREDLQAEAVQKKRSLDDRLKKESRPQVNRVIEQLKPLLKGLSFYQKRILIEQLVSLAE